MAVLWAELRRGCHDGPSRAPQGAAAPGDDRLWRFRHGHGYTRESCGQGSISDGRAFYRSRRYCRIDAAMGHDVQSPAEATGVRLLCRKTGEAPRATTRDRRGPSPDVGLSRSAYDAVGTFAIRPFRLEYSQALTPTPNRDGSVTFVG